MYNLQSVFRDLTSSYPNGDIKGKLLFFAKQLGWSPSYFFDPKTEEPANAYLVIEHGLENAAVISFLKKPRINLTYEERENLLALSYNNLVNWHIAVDSDKIAFFYVLNNTDKRLVEELRIERDREEESLRVEIFEKVVGKRPSPNIKSLDNVLMDTISVWKRTISAALENKVELESISVLFNGLILLRAVEDFHKRKGIVQPGKQILLEKFSEHHKQKGFTLALLFEVTRKYLNIEIPITLLDFSKLDAFDLLNHSDVSLLLRDFYEISNTNFTYDFSVLTKHALSRIYEKYVSVLAVQETPQLALWSQVPEEKHNKSKGAFYTPEYIARFFAKFLQREVSHSQFKNLKICEPAVGSGIFLRTLIELQLEKLSPSFDSDEAKKVFQNILALDEDYNACLATRLSLSLLYYLFYESFYEPNVIQVDSIEFFLNHQEVNESYDVVISNPPFIPYDRLSPKMRENIDKVVQGLVAGKSDSYLAFLKIAVDVLKPGGYGLFVLPNNFLIGRNAEKIRSYISSNTEIRLLADLSTIKVFDSLGVYVILLIFQKKSMHSHQEGSSLIVKCNSSVGEALELALKGTILSNKRFSIYESSSDSFDRKEWFILNSQEHHLEKKISGFPEISNFLDVKQGFITANDEIFIRRKELIPKKEFGIYKPHILDKEMMIYNIPTKIEHFVFYPFLEHNRLTELEIESIFPETWKYLLIHQAKLNQRANVKRGILEWWMTHTPGSPEHILQPKILTPHITISPKFSIDEEGLLTPSHSPYLILKNEYPEKDLLYFFTGIINSLPCFWYISTHSHRVGNGFNRLEVSTLKTTPVPDPTHPQNRVGFMRMVQLVKERLSAKEREWSVLEKEINKISFELYQLNEEEIQTLTFNEL